MVAVPPGAYATLTMSDLFVQPDWIPDTSLRRLSPDLIDDPLEIRRLILRVWDQGLALWRGTNRHAVQETAKILTVGSDSFRIRPESFDWRDREQVFLNVQVDGVAYLFASRLRESSRQELELLLPSAVYRSERRDRPRRVGSGSAFRVSAPGGTAFLGREDDRSDDGLGLTFEEGVALSEGDTVRVTDATLSGREASYAEVRRVSEPCGEGRWRRVGLVITHGPRSPQVDVRQAELERSAADRAPRLRRAPARYATYRNSSGEELRAIVDCVGDPAFAKFVVIPPAWGRTKESTVGLSETILSTLSSAGKSVVVVRFDGVRRRGESFNEPDCLPPVGENRRYTFSQGVRDIESTIDFLEGEYGAGPRSVFLLTFSIAAVEGRKAIVRDSRNRIGGWVSLVGAVDPQSMIRVVSGGVDYFAGAAQGVEFGDQYIQGLLLDVDGATRDAIESRLAFLDDARRDMARVRIPVTWILGAADAWTSAARVRDIMSIGDVSRRRIIEVPTGHQLRSSREALAVFGLATRELAEMAFGELLAPVEPSRSELRSRRLQERRRLQRAAVDLRTFWRDYLVGREHPIGIELVSATEAFRSLMETQIAGLRLAPGMRLLDLGSGAGALPVALGGRPDIHGLLVAEVDLVLEGLVRARRRVAQGHCGGHEYSYVAAGVDPATSTGLPFADGVADAVLASLVINYLKEPTSFLREVARVLRPGGRLVVSGMKPDADVSRICVAGTAELRSGEVRAVWERDEVTGIDGPLQEFISSGARLLDLEEEGLFNFWGAEELRGLFDSELFEILEQTSGYGDPPQALVVVAERRAVRAS